MQLQLDLFKPIAEIVDLSEKANALLDALNDGANKRYHYEPKLYMQFNDVIVLGACNKQNEYIFNMIDLEGNTPKDCCVCWRIAPQVRQDLIKHLEKQGTLID